MNFSKLEAVQEAFRVAKSPYIRVGTLDPHGLDPLCGRLIHPSTELICMLCKHLNKTPIFVRPPKLSFGHCNNETNICSGMLGMLQRGEVDIVANIYLYIADLFPLLQYTSYIQEIQPVYIYGPRIGSHMSKASDDDMNLGLTNLCFGFIFMILFLVFLVQWGKHRIRGEKVTAFKVLWKTFEGFMGQTFRGKLIFFCFFPIVIVTQTAFKGQALSATYPRLPFTDSKDLARLVAAGKYKIILPSIDVKNILLERVPEMNYAMRRHPPEFDFVNSIKVRKRVCYSDNIISLSYMERYMGPMCNFFSQKDIKYLGEDKYYFGAMVSRYVPKWLFERIQRTVIRVFTPDVYRYWIMAKYVPFSYTNEVTGQAIASDEQLKIKSWMKCICSVMTGYITAILVFWIELIVHHHRQKTCDKADKRHLKRPPSYARLISKFDSIDSCT